MHPVGALRDDVDERLREIKKALDDNIGDEAVQAEIVAIRRDFELGEDHLEPVPDFDALPDCLSGSRTIATMPT